MPVKSSLEPSATDRPSTRSRPRRLTPSSVPPIFPSSPECQKLILSPVLYGQILSYLPVKKFASCALVCRAFRQIVYDDANWIILLRQIRIWDSNIASEYKINEERRKNAKEIIIHDLQGRKITPLNVLSTVHSFPGYARLEFSRVYKLLGPLYQDLTDPPSAVRNDPNVFKLYRSPEEQAQILNTLNLFSFATLDSESSERRQRLLGIIGIFENAALKELETGLEDDDFEGKARRYSNVLILLNGGNTAIQTYVQHAPIFSSISLPSAGACFRGDDKTGTVKVDLTPVKKFLELLSKAVSNEETVIQKVFAENIKIAKHALTAVIDRVVEDLLGEYTTSLVEIAHGCGNADVYLQTVAGTYEALLRFTYDLLVDDHAEDEKEERKRLRVFHSEVHEVVDRAYEQHVDIYLQEEIDKFKQKCEYEVNTFEKRAAKQELETETKLRNKYKDSTSSKDSTGDERFDFLTSFKKVILLPVVAIGNPGLHITSSSSKASSSVRDDISEKQSITTIGNYNQKDVLPASELAASAAILNSRLDSIRTLFSLEVALNLIQAARESIERTALFSLFEGQTGDEAKEQCQLIFVSLLESLGFRHIEHGFDKALQHLTEYRPPTAPATSVDNAENEKTERPKEVEPLVTFLELVNVGDLIQQMVDVFYEKELVGRRFVDRTDFLSPAFKEKRKFEQMLDEHVALGLNRGIDVLIEQVNYILATQQKRNEFNINNYTVHSGVNKADTYVTSSQVIDSRLGPTDAAIKVVDTVSSHTRLLNGNTDKTTLDVFLQEVGLRLYNSLSKHIKKQTIAVDGGAVLLISDLNYYYRFVETDLRQKVLLPYFAALREIAQLYLIDSKSSREIGIVMTDVVQKFAGIVNAEDLLEFVQCRADWLLVKRNVEKSVYGMGITDCCVM
ncbi:exocyst complex component Sec10-like protein [Lipomyces japonicus]|uniref:exocyst complex component Sec10-like protein n=1 Tax=Lipomyces japonicus TaxID=56871 RepID=UPI0034CE7696